MATKKCGTISKKTYKKYIKEIKKGLDKPTNSKKDQRFLTITRLARNYERIRFFLK